MKKLLKLFITFALVVVSVFGIVGCNDASKNTPTTGLQYKKYVNEDFYTVYGYVNDGKTTELEISADIDGVPVKRIAANAFKNNGVLTSVIVPDSVTEIGEGAFAGMSALEELTIPFVGGFINADVKFSDTKEDVDKAVDAERNFAYIFGKEEFEFGKKTTSYYNAEGNATYYLPIKLRTVTVKNQNEYKIPMFAFNGVDNLTAINLQGNLVEIGENAFDGCKGLAKIVIPASVTEIHKKAFVNCGLTEIEFEQGSNLKVIGDYAFEKTNVKNLVLPASVEEIGASAFAESALESVVLSASLKKIGDYGFYACKKLVAVSGASNVAVGNAVFKNCELLDCSAFGSMFDIGDSANVYEGTKNA